MLRPIDQNSRIFSNESQLREYIDEITDDQFYTYVNYKEFSMDFLRQFRDKLNWTAIICNQELDEKQIDEFKQKKEIWNSFAVLQFTTKKFDRYKEYLGWYDRMD